MLCRDALANTKPSSYIVYDCINRINNLPTESTTEEKEAIIYGACSVGLFGFPFPYS